MKIFNACTDDFRVGETCRHDAAYEVGKRRDAIHEDPETR